MTDTTEKKEPKVPPYYIGYTFKGRRTADPLIGHNKLYREATHDKSARRLIRQAFDRSLHRIDQKIMKARDVRLELERLATNSHEAKRYLDQTLALHQPAPAFVTRSQARAKNRGPIMAERAAEQQRRVDRAEARATAEAKRAETATLDTTEKALGGEKLLRVGPDGKVV